MGNKVAFTNPTGKYLAVGSKTVPPHGTREVDEDHIPPKFKQKKAGEPEKAPSDPLLELLNKKVGEVITAIKARNEDGSPVINAEQFEQLELAESEGKQRAGVISGFTEERLARSSEEADNGAEESE
jgi:hypothetical protein